MEPFAILFTGDQYDYRRYRFPDNNVKIKSVIISSRGPVFLSETGSVYVTPPEHEFDDNVVLLKLPITEVQQISATVNPKSVDLWVLDSKNELISVRTSYGDPDIDNVSFNEYLDEETDEVVLRFDHKKKIKSIEYPYILTGDNRIFYLEYGDADEMVNVTPADLEGQQIVRISPPNLQEENLWCVDNSKRLWFNFEGGHQPLNVPPGIKAYFATPYYHALGSEGYNYGIVFKFSPENTILHWISYSSWTIRLIDHPDFQIQQDSSGYLYIRYGDGPLEPLDYITEDTMLTDVQDGLHWTVKSAPANSRVIGGIGAPILPFSEYQQDLPFITKFKVLSSDRYGQPVIRYQLPNGQTKYVRILLANDQVFAPGRLITEEAPLPSSFSPDYGTLINHGRISVDSTGKESWYYVFDDGNEFTTYTFYAYSS